MKILFHYLKVSDKIARFLALSTSNIILYSSKSVHSDKRIEKIMVKKSFSKSLPSRQHSLETLPLFPYLTASHPHQLNRPVQI